MFALPALILPLGLDTFAVSAALGLGGLPARERLRIALLFTTFEAGMPLIGLAAGVPLRNAIGPAAGYVAIALLFAMGIYTLVFDEGDDGERRKKPSGSWGAGALILGLSVSLDELAIGFTIGLLRLPIIPVVIFIAAQAFIAAQVGVRLGARAGERVHQNAERIAGFVFIALALALAAEKLLG